MTNFVQKAFSEIDADPKKTGIDWHERRLVSKLHG
jgi:hypothetical protein